MDTQCTTTANQGYPVNFTSGVPRSGNGEGVMSEEEEQEDDEEEEEQPSGNGRTTTLAQHSPPAVTEQTQSSVLADWTSNTEGETEIIYLFQTLTSGLNSLTETYIFISLLPLFDCSQCEHQLHGCLLSG